MTIVQLRYALAVERHLNFSKAAEQLYISQPALSLQIKTLEQELQKMLFLRTPQGVVLTPEGKNFCREAAVIMEAWEQFNRKFVGSTDEKVHTQLRIGMGPRALSTGIFDQTMEFYNRQDGVEVTFIATDLDGNPLEYLLQNRVDFVIDRLPPSPVLQSMNLDDFTVVELLQERQCVLMSPLSPLSSRESLTFDDLKECNIISGPKGSIDDLAMQKLCRRYGLRADNLYRADNLNLMMELIRSNKGITIGPESLGSYFPVTAVPMVPEKYVPLTLMCLQSKARNSHFIALRDYLCSLPAAHRAQQTEN